MSRTAAPGAWGTNLTRAEAVGLSPEQALWQRVVMQALLDATRDAKGQEATMAKRAADTWIRDGGRHYRDVCAMAGMEADFIRDAYIAGRINRDRLRRVMNDDKETDNA